MKYMKIALYSPFQKYWNNEGNSFRRNAFNIRNIICSQSKAYDSNLISTLINVNQCQTLPPLSSAIWISFGLMAWLASRSTEIKSLACFMLLGVKKV